MGLIKGEIGEVRREACAKYCVTKLNEGWGMRVVLPR
jgi:hypothetical protein